jgi:predicted Fe-Mo cluster-binding NifX family protein
MALGISVISAVASFIVSRQERKIGEKIKSQSLITIAEDTRINAFISLLVIVGIVTTYFGIRHVEGGIGILISLMIFKIAIENGKSSIFSLLDVRPSKELVDKISEVIKSVKGVKKFSDLRLRNAGPFVIGEVKIKTKKFLDVKRAHEISDKIEDKVTNEIEEVISLHVHIEPYKGDKNKIVIPVEDNKGLDSKLSSHFGRAKYFLFVNLKKKNIESTYFRENDYKKKKVRAGLFAVKKMIVDEDVDSVMTKSIGTISLHSLRDNLISVYRSEKNKARDAIQDFAEGNLELLEEPTKELGQESVEKK